VTHGRATAKGNVTLGPEYKLAARLDARGTDIVHHLQHLHDTIRHEQSSFEHKVAALTDLWQRLWPHTSPKHTSIPEGIRNCAGKGSPYLKAESN